MESRFAKLMQYSEQFKLQAKHPIKAESDVPGETISKLTLEASTQRAKMESITGQKITVFEELGKFINIEFNGPDKEMDKETIEDFRLTAEKAMFFGKVADYLGNGYHIVLGKENDKTIRNKDQIRIMVIEAEGLTPKIIYSRVLITFQAIDLINAIFTPKLDERDLDERQELRDTLVSHLKNGNLVSLNPARKLN
jgi:hypothetical protein